MTNDSMQQIIQRVLWEKAGTNNEYDGNRKVLVGGIGVEYVSEAIAQALREAGYVKIASKPATMMREAGF